MLAAQPLKVPVMLVHSLWDQEDIYGAIAVYKAIEPKDTANDKVFLVMGPWHHGQEIGDGSALGPLKFDSDTALLFPAGDSAAVPRSVPQGRRAESRRRAGHGIRDRHERLAPTAGLAGRLRDGLPHRADAAYLGAGLKATLDRASAGGAAFDEYVSDPAKPVPFIARARSLRRAARRGRTGWSTISARRQAGPTLLAFVIRRR